MVTVETLEAEFAPARQLNAEERLALLLQIFDGVGQKLEVGKGEWIVGPGDWTCDGGTLALAFLADMLGLQRKVHVGLYWHSRAETLAAIRGFSLRLTRKYPLDEHHHWLEVKVGRAGWWRIDPNAEVRNEARLQRVGESAAYESRPDLVAGLSPRVSTRRRLAREGKLLDLISRTLKRAMRTLGVDTLVAASEGRWGEDEAPLIGFASLK